MGTTESFNLVVGATTYVVHYDSMTHWVTGSKKNLMVGALVTVTRTLTHSPFLRPNSALSSFLCRLQCGDECVAGSMEMTYAH